MKKCQFLIIGLLLVVGNTLSAQIDKQHFQNNWIKTETLRADSSRIFDPTLTGSAISLRVLNGDSLQFSISNRMQNYKYTFLNSVLVFGMFTFKIQELSAQKLVLIENTETDVSKAIMLVFMPKNLFDLTYTPEYYLAKNKEIVYKALPGKLEPLFRDKNMSAVDYVFERFGFPEYKKGGFVVRFVINQKGELKGAKIVATSNERYNEKLIQAVNKTKGKWLPATYQGKPINVEVEFNFNLGFEDRQISSIVDSTAYSQNYYNTGNEFFQSGSHKQAEKYYQKAIDYDPLNINAYYQHAAVSIALRKKDQACKDFQQLIFLDQKKAIKLQQKYCN
jgi:tetratricopeptide (TPR) repeat protein